MREHDPQTLDHPPYEPRFYPAEIKRDGGRVEFGGFPVLYPGEVAHVEWDGGDTATWVIEPAPGIRARLRRWRYRLGVA